MLLKKHISEKSSEVIFQKTILLVEDDRATAKLTSKQLQARGYNVIHHRSGESALKEVKVNSRIDLIAMDIDLGEGMDGPTAAAKILKDHDIPLLFLSSHTEPEIVEKTERITNYGYVVKNSSITVLDASIKMAFKLFDAKRREEEKELALLEKTRLLQNITDHMFDVVAITSMTGDIKIISRSNDLLGYGVDPLIGENIFSYVHPDDLPKIAASFQEALDTKIDGKRVELRLRNHKGQYLWFETFGKYMKGELLFSSRNIDERKKAEEKFKRAAKRNKLLLKELQHRTKNNLNQIISILELMADPLPIDAQTLIRDIQGRILSISSIYELLYKTSDLEHIDFPLYLQKLASSILSTFNHKAKNIQLTTRLEPLVINAKLATELGLILNELITNTLKYAYPHDQHGELYIELNTTGKKVTIIVADHGVGMPATHQVEPLESIGMLLTELLTKQIEGTLTIEDNKPGVKTTITFSI